jgi:hypothetical protein
MDPEIQNQQPNKILEAKPGSSFSKLRVFSFVVVGLLVISASAVLLWFLVLDPGMSGEDSGTIPSTETITVPDIESNKDLEKLENEVKGIDIDGLSKELDANDTDSKDF